MAARVEHAPPSGTARRRLRRRLAVRSRTTSRAACSGTRTRWRVLRSMSSSSLVALFADALATHDPTEILFRANGRVAANRPLGEGFILGTTNLGRDIYSQLVYGSRSALLVGLTAAVFVVAIGTLAGLALRLFRRLDRLGHHAPRRRRARDPVPALRDRARGFPAPEHLERRDRRRAPAVAEHRPGDPRRRC